MYGHLYVLFYIPKLVAPVYATYVNMLRCLCCDELPSIVLKTQGTQLDNDYDSMN